MVSGPAHGRICTRHAQALRMDVLDSLGYNSSMAEALAQAHALTGSWRSITQDLRAAEALTSRDVQEVTPYVRRRTQLSMELSECRQEVQVLHHRRSHSAVRRTAMHVPS